MQSEKFEKRIFQLEYKLSWIENYLKEQENKIIKINDTIRNVAFILNTAYPDFIITESKINLAPPKEK